MTVPPRPFGPNMLRVVLFAALTMTCSASAALARDYFEMDRSAVETRMRPAIEVAFPGANFNAQCGKPGTLRYCRYDLPKPFTVRIVETFGGKTDIAAFMSGAPSPIYEVSVELSTDTTSQADLDRFTDLCAAAVSAIRTTPMAKSKALVTGLIKKADAKRIDLAQARQSDKASTVIVDYGRAGDGRCRVTAEDDYLPGSGLYKAGEDVP